MKYIAIKDDVSTHKQWGFNFVKGKIYKIDHLGYLKNQDEFPTYLLHGDKLAIQVYQIYVENYFIPINKLRKDKLIKISKI